MILKDLAPGFSRCFCIIRGRQIWQPAAYFNIPSYILFCGSRFSCWKWDWEHLSLQSLELLVKDPSQSSPKMVKTERRQPAVLICLLAQMLTEASASKALLCNIISVSRSCPTILTQLYYPQWNISVGKWKAESAGDVHQLRASK